MAGWMGGWMDIEQMQGGPLFLYFCLPFFLSLALSCRRWTAVYVLVL
jgi:hypothetical protein